MSTAQSGHEAAGAAGASVSVARRPPTTAESLFDLSRGRQATISIAQPGLAAVLAAGGMPGARVVAIGLVAAWAGFFAVFSLNDVLDRRVDAAALRAGKAEDERLRPRRRVSASPAGAGHSHLCVSRCSGWQVSRWWPPSAPGSSARCASPCSARRVALEVLYCGLRSVTWVKTVISGVMVGCGGLAGWAAVAPLALGRRCRCSSSSRSGRSGAATSRTTSPTSGRTAPSASARWPRPSVRRSPRAPTSWSRRPCLRRCRSWASVARRWPWRWRAARCSSPGRRVRLYREPTSARAGWYFNLASLYPVAVLLTAVGAWAAGRL